MSHRQQILVLASDPRSRAQIERLLLSAGHAPTLAQSTSAALSALDDRAFDLVVVDAGDDLQAELIAEVRRRASLLELPIIALTSPGASNTASLIKSGANDVLSRARAAKLLPRRLEHLLALRQRAENPTRAGRSTPPADARCTRCRAALDHPDRPCPHCRSQPPQQGWPPVVGSPFGDLGATLAGQYRLTHVAGTGHTGVVYKALELESHSTCAVKIIDLGQAPHRPSDERLLARIEREVQALVCLRTPHVVHIHDFFRLRPGVFALVMTYVDGLSLHDHLEQLGPLAPEVAVDVLDQLCRALAEAHSLGMVHRDLKPDNIMLRPLPNAELFATLLDFGLVSILDTAGGNERFYGTLRYASPEQLVDGRAVDHRADIYSLGAVFFHAVSGHPPFKGTHPAALLSQHLKAPVPSIADHLPDPEAPFLAPLEALLRWMLAKRPDDRPGSMGEVLEQLRDMRAGG